MALPLSGSLVPAAERETGQANPAKAKWKFSGNPPIAAPLHNGDGGETPEMRISALLSLSVTKGLMWCRTAHWLDCEFLREQEG
jgi:hypothetical protein